MIRVGLAGAGWVSEHHLQAWATQRGRAQVVAIAAPRLDAAEVRAHQFEIPNVFPSAEVLLAATAVDAIDIAAPREFHAPLFRLAARHGLAILCQKPLAPTLQEAEALVCWSAGANGGAPWPATAVEADNRPGRSYACARIAYSIRGEAPRWRAFIEQREPA